MHVGEGSFDLREEVLELMEEEVWGQKAVKEAHQGAVDRGDEQQKGKRPKAKGRQGEELGQGVRAVAQGHHEDQTQAQKVEEPRKYNQGEGRTGVNPVVSLKDEDREDLSQSPGKSGSSQVVDIVGGEEGLEGAAPAQEEVEAQASHYIGGQHHHKTQEKEAGRGPSEESEKLSQGDLLQAIEQEEGDQGDQQGQQDLGEARSLHFSEPLSQVLRITLANLNP